MRWPSSSTSCISRDTYRVQLDDRRRRVVHELQALGLGQARRALQDLVVGRAVPFCLERIQKARNLLGRLVRTGAVRLRERGNGLVSNTTYLELDRPHVGRDILHPRFGIVITTACGTLLFLRVAEKLQHLIVRQQRRARANDAHR